MADEYDFSEAVPNPYAERMKDGFTVRIVSDEVDRRQARLVTNVSATDIDDKRVQADDEDLHR